MAPSAYELHRRRAVHLEKDGKGGEPMLGEHLVEGLLVAGRLLAGYPDGGAADDALAAQ